MSDFVNNPPEPLTSIPGRARIVDGAGNPIDPDNPPAEWQQPQPAQQALPPSDRMHGASVRGPDEDEDADTHEHKGGKHARTVHQRRSRTSE